MPLLDRRSFLALCAASAACGVDPAPDPDASAAPPDSSFPVHFIGANTAISGLGFFEALDVIHDLGFRTVEVQNLVGRLEPTKGAFPGFVLDDLSDSEREQVQAAVEPFAHVTAHLPYPPSMPYINPGADEAVEALDRALDAVELVGGKLAVLHPQPSGADLYANWDVAVERIRRWGSMAADRGFALACETSMPRSLPDLLRFHEEIDHPNVGVTLDVGHQADFEELAAIPEGQRSTPESIQAYNDLNLRIVDALDEKLIHLHVHDIEPATWAEHKPLVHDFIDYAALINKLRATRYDGVLVFEIGGDPAAMPGYLRDGKRILESHLARA